VIKPIKPSWLDLSIPMKPIKPK